MTVDDPTQVRTMYAGKPPSVPDVRRSLLDTGIVQNLQDGGLA